jgi:hypothetical protein
MKKYTLSLLGIFVAMALIMKYGWLGWARQLY